MILCFCFDPLATNFNLNSRKTKIGIFLKFLKSSKCEGIFQQHGCLSPGVLQPCGGQAVGRGDEGGVRRLCHRQYRAVRPRVQVQSAPQCVQYSVKCAM